MFMTGVGSRKTPDTVLVLMENIGAWCKEKGIVVRSGGAQGADTAFQIGAGDCFELYEPWPGFAHIQPRHPKWYRTWASRPTAPAYATVDKYHPEAKALGRGGLACMARNAHQVLGLDLDEPSEFLVCWTPDGEISGIRTTKCTGGTGQAIRIASTHGVYVWNLQLMADRTTWMRQIMNDTCVCVTDVWYRKRQHMRTNQCPLCGKGWERFFDLVGKEGRHA